MPAGYGKQCQNCYWNGLLEKRIQMDSSAFSTLGLAQSFEAFGHWLGGKIGGHKAALAIHRYLPFFIEIGHQWGNLPSYDELLRHFGTQRLRRVLLAMRWMEAVGLVFVRVGAKEEESERRRIANALNRFLAVSPERAILDGYHESLQGNLLKGETTLRSIRLAMSPAAALLLKAKEIEAMPPDQRALAAYLEISPGQRAAVSGFVRYLREVMAVEIVLPRIDVERAKRNRKQRLEARMLKVMQAGVEGQMNIRRWLSVALAYFHRLPEAIGRGLLKEQIVIHQDGSFTVTWNGKKYWVPKIV
jgi:hypothetical protein